MCNYSIYNRGRRSDMITIGCRAITLRTSSATTTLLSRTYCRNWSKTFRSVPAILRGFIFRRKKFSVHRPRSPPVIINILSFRYWNRYIIRSRIVVTIASRPTCSSRIAVLWRAFIVQIGSRLGEFWTITLSRNIWRPRTPIWNRDASCLPARTIAGICLVKYCSIAVIGSGWGPCNKLISSILLILRWTNPTRVIFLLLENGSRTCRGNVWSPFVPIRNMCTGIVSIFISHLRIFIIYTRKTRLFRLRLFCIKLFIA